MESVLLGAGGVVHGARPGSVVIDTSTIDPAATRTIAAALAERGVDMLDAPVSGGPQGARDATLSIMVGGRADVLAHVRPLLDCLGAAVRHMGGHGAGQATKACNQLLLLVTAQGVAEALTLARRAGLDPGQVREALLAGMASSRVLDFFGERMARRDFAAGIESRLYHKDLDIVLGPGARAGRRAPGRRRHDAARQRPPRAGPGTRRPVGADHPGGDARARRRRRARRTAMIPQHVIGAHVEDDLHDQGGGGNLKIESSLCTLPRDSTAPRGDGRTRGDAVPVVSVNGPRQSGKTTLLRRTFPRHRYVSLETPDERAFALEDPRGFLGRFDGPVILTRRSGRPICSRTSRRLSMRSRPPADSCSPVPATSCCCGASRSRWRDGCAWLVCCRSRWPS